MKQRYILILILLLLPGLASCTPGHVGGNEIAFVRDGHLWTIDPNGANAFAIVTDSSPVIGYSWSPTHQILAFRTLDTDFAKTAAGKHTLYSPLTGTPGDLPSTLNTIGIDGGFPIPLILSRLDTQYSNAWWNSAGDRLFYRATVPSQQTNPTVAQWWISQDDQPEGIARKSFPTTFSIPSMADNSNLAIGNSNSGIFTTARDGTNIQYVIRQRLPGHPLPATLERVLWQPAHDTQHFLFAIAPSSQKPGPFTISAANMTVQLMLGNVQGQMTSLATCTCTQFAWSPDGNSILYTTGTTYTLFHLNTHSSFSFSGEDGSAPYWSPDSQFLLLNGIHTLSLIAVASGQQNFLLSDGYKQGSGEGATSQPNSNALLQPALNSPWSADSRHFLFLTQNRFQWQEKNLHTGRGLYVVSLDDHGNIQGEPAVVDTGNDSQAGWTYEDPNTSFLF